jgi:hypothetical protein
MAEANALAVPGSYKGREYARLGFCRVGAHRLIVSRAPVCLHCGVADYLSPDRSSGPQVSVHGEPPGPEHCAPSSQKPSAC